ncbi:MAG: right-handed parallel beta-helix repeat-containing protein [Actinomycetia bacterium]|nr:right-handed parallel beta-helix repeat-containing protein [Actinomycetes bacterium]
MTMDLSRIVHDPAKRYASVRMQQGRVILDDDWNDQATTTTTERVQSLTDVIGPSGTSDDAFRVGTPTTPDGNIDFPLGEGTFYIGGHRLPVEANLAFRHQHDLLTPPAVAAPAGQRHDLVWLEAWEQPVTAVEDRELREVGLGGPDTAARTRLLARVHVEPDVGTDDCADAWDATVGAHVNARGRLETDVTATVTFQQDGDPDDLCSPDAITGYLRHDNQAIRVQLTSPTSFCWGFDNASPLYRVEIQADRREIVFATLPKDEAHRPRSGQVVELLAWGAELRNGEKMAEPLGVFGVVQQGYDPDDHSIRLQAALPAFESGWLDHPEAAEIGADGTFVYLRVWDRGDDPTPPEIAFAPGGAAVPLGTTGLEIEFDGTQFRAGDYWVLAARPAEPNRVVPWELADARPPHGPQRMRAPLALIDWVADDTPVVEDCRRRFRSLTELKGCCEYTVGDGEHNHGDFTSIQTAIEALPPQGGRVCVNPGIYEERLTLRSVHDVEIRGCGPDVRLVPERDGAAIAIDDSTAVTITGMHIETPLDVGIAIGHELACTDVELSDLSIASGPRASAIDVRNDTEAAQSTGLEIRGCVIEASLLDAPPDEGDVIELWPAIFSQCDDVLIEDNRVTTPPSKLRGALGGVQIGGLSTNVVIRRNHIEGGNGHGIVIGSIHWEPDEVFEAVEGVEAVEYLAGPSNYIGIITTFLEQCLDIGIPNPPDDGDGPSLTPVSDGLIEHLVIEDNVITAMGGDGIGVVRFFRDEERDIIGVEHLRIRGNDIMGNRLTPPPIVPASLAATSGHGGIALGSVVDGTFERNRIAMNGRSSLRPVCGLFIVAGAGISVVDNQIAANGFGGADDNDAQIGRRGGIVVLLAVEIDVPTAGRERPARDVSALRVVDNVVDQPVGQALSVLARGRVVAHGNQFSAGVLPVAAVLRGVLAMIRQGDLAQALLLTLTHLVGSAVSIIDLGFPIDPALQHLVERWARLPKGSRNAAQMIWSGEAASAESSEAAAEEASGAAAAAPAEEEEDGASAQPTLAVSSSVGRFGRAAAARPLLAGLLSGGHVMFNDNQVLLDLVEGELGITLSSVLVASLDDVSVHDNQMRCVTDFDIVFANAIAVALNTVRFGDNRCQEPPHAWYEATKLGVLGTRMSYVTAALVNTTTSNQSTNRFRAFSINPTTQVVDHNLVLHP